METVKVWISGHMFLTGLLAGMAAVIVAVISLWSLVFFIAAIRSKFKADRSGANLTVSTFTTFHDRDNDQIVFTWTLKNRGKFAAREVRLCVSFRSTQKDGVAATWRLNRTIALLGPADRVDVAIPIARGELARLAGDFDNGAVSLWSYYSSTRPNRAPNGFSVAGPRMRFKLAVGKVGNQDCVTVTDFMAVDYFGRDPPTSSAD